MVRIIGVFFFQAEDGIRDADVTGVQTCALPILSEVLGRAGRLRIQNAWGDGPNTATALEITDAQRNTEVEEFPPTDQFWLQLQHLQDCLDNGTPHRIPPADSITQMRVIGAAVYASLKT